jgi:hypothetical protein
VAGAWILAVALAATPAAAVTIEINYTYDTSNFFGAGNPDGATAGAQARNALEAAADFYSDILEDSLAQIATPAPFTSGPGTGRLEFGWELAFSDPSNPEPEAQVHLVDQFIPANVFRVYVGAETLLGNTLAATSSVVSGATWESTGTYLPQEWEDAETRIDDWELAVEQRGQPVGEFVAWGGSISFDNDGSSNWHFNHLTSVPFGKSDFYSVALHELGHTLGFGFGDVWDSNVNGTQFIGPAAVAEYGGNVPLRCVGGQCDHWAEGTQSETYLTSMPQEALLDPTANPGVRKQLTKLDAAALTDLGWEVAAAPDPPMLAGDYNGDQRVTAADYIVWRNSMGDTGPNLPADGNGNNQIDQGDYTVWRNHFGETLGSGSSAAVPEPGCAVLLMVLVIGALVRRPLKRAAPGAAHFSGRRVKVKTVQRGFRFP